MKTLKSVLLFLLVTTLILSCKKNEWSCISGKGETVTQNRSELNFRRIHLSINATIDFVQDSSYKVEISAQQNILNVLTTKVEGDKLVIGFKENVRKHNPIHLIIHAPAIQGFEISGSGNINSHRKIISRGLDLHVSGSGNIFLTETETNYLNCNISGSGNIEVQSGKTDSENFTMSGSGNIHSLGLVSRISTSRISGSGNIKLNCSEQLDVHISGSGNLTYKGHPAVKSSISGSGKLIHID